ncbi:hypothetical protein [Pleomorphovibrio marinus]|uniref:hypothetical protein n=1 Tax=Pleomorphovibrio marinus TaxID=2164132 RepID=UPI000E0CAB4F|nr:hypothetical protein [Pleomorphovibrio marinus]
METEQKTLLHHFELQMDVAKALFLELAKKIKSKKVIPLESRLFACGLYLNLLAKIHFEEKRLVSKIFSPFEDLLKNLKKAHHIKIIEEAFISNVASVNGKYLEYSRFILSDKKRVYAKLFDLIISTPLSVWEEFFLQVAKRSQSLTPLQVNTASHQIINDELEGVDHAAKQHLDATRIKEIYEGLQAIIEVEKIRVSMNLNPVFTPNILQEMDQLTKDLYYWYKSHLLLQHLSHFLRDKEEIAEPYLKLLKGIRKNQKAFTLKIKKDWESLIERMGN